MYKLPIPETLLENARTLRKNQTNAEKLLWGLLRNQQLAGAKFRRQHPLPPYVLDFYCHPLRLAIELDGGQHAMDPIRRYDQRRTASIEKAGITVLRFWNHEMLSNPSGIIELLWYEVQNRKP
jgi:type I restriction enzyme M protein